MNLDIAFLCKETYVKSCGGAGKRVHVHIQEKKDSTFSWADLMFPYLFRLFF